MPQLLACLNAHIALPDGRKAQKGGWLLAGTGCKVEVLTKQCCKQTLHQRHQHWHVAKLLLEQAQD